MYIFTYSAALHSHSGQPIATSGNVAAKTGPLRCTQVLQYSTGFIEVTSISLLFGRAIIGLIAVAVTPTQWREHSGLSSGRHCGSVAEGDVHYRESEAAGRTT